MISASVTPLTGKALQHALVMWLDIDLYPIHPETKLKVIRVSGLRLSPLVTHAGTLRHLCRGTCPSDRQPVPSRFALNYRLSFVKPPE